MPFNGNGVFNRLYNWVNDAANNINIKADRMDAEMAGFATALSNCLTRDGQSGMLADLDLGNFKAFNMASPTLGHHGVNLTYLKDNPSWLINTSNQVEFKTQPVFGAGYKISGNFPQIIFEELDQFDPAGRFRIYLNGELFTLTKATEAGGFANEQIIFRVRPGLNPKRVEFLNDYALYTTDRVMARDGQFVFAEDGFNFLRAKVGTTNAGYGLFFRHDANNFYMLLTDSNDADGTFNSLRPFTLSKSTGRVTFAQGVDLSSNAGLTLGSAIAITKNALSKHIDLYGGTYGINVSGATLGIVVPDTASVSIFSGTQLDPPWWSFSGASLIQGGGVDVASNTQTGANYGAGVSLQHAGTLPNNIAMINAYYGTVRQFMVRRDGLIQAGDFWINGTQAGVPAAYISAKSGNQFIAMSGVDTEPSFQFRSSSNAIAARIDADDANVLSLQTIITRRKGDGRYAFKDTGAFTGLTTFGGAVDIAGLTTLANALSFGSRATADQFDLSKHIQLYGTSYGIGVSGNSFNLVAPTGAAYRFVAETGTIKAQVEQAGTSAPNAYSIITREKGDLRYANLGATADFHPGIVAAVRFDAKGSAAAGFRMTDLDGTTERGYLYCDTTAMYLRRRVGVTTHSQLVFDNSGNIEATIGQFKGSGAGLTDIPASALPSTAAERTRINALYGGSAANAIGTLMFAIYTSPGAVNFGANVAGNLLRPTAANGHVAGALRGAAEVWKCLGQLENVTGNENRTTLWMRVS